MGMSLEQVDSSRPTIKPSTARTSDDPPIPDIVVNQSVTMERKVAPDRRQRIAEAAYIIAERRGFEPGHELEDWLTAEVMISQASV